MSIVLRETDWAKKMIASHDLGKKPTETLRRVARYYMDTGYSKKETRNKLDEFMLRCDPDTSLPRWANTLDNIVKYAAKGKSINIDEITVSQTELDTITGIKSRMEQRLAFTLLCLSKYYIAVNPSFDNWVSTPENEIMALANIKTSIKRQCAMYYELRELGLIQLSKKIDSTSVKVLFADDNEPVLHITDFRNLGYRYLMHRGEPFFECEHCGIVTKYKDPKNKRRQKYCNDCSIKLRTQAKVEAIMRFRQKKNSECNTLTSPANP